MNAGYALLFFLAFGAISIGVAKGLALPFVHTCEDQVRQAGGTVLKTQVRLFCRGPFFWSLKTQHIVKVIYRDPDGQVRQLWGRSGSLFGADRFARDYNDGDNRI